MYTCTLYLRVPVLQYCIHMAIACYEYMYCNMAIPVYCLDCNTHQPVACYGHSRYCITGIEKKIQYGHTGTGTGIVHLRIENQYCKIQNTYSSTGTDTYYCNIHDTLTTGSAWRLCVKLELEQGSMFHKCACARVFR